MVVDEAFKQWIRNCEYYKKKPYLDSQGKLTIGYGRNLQENGLSLEEAEFLMKNDIKRAEEELKGFHWYRNQPDNVKKALLNMNFNLGLPRLLSFKKMINALMEKDYAKAAAEALNSKWAEQVGNRATDIAVMIREASN